MKLEEERFLFDIFGVDAVASTLGTTVVLLVGTEIRDGCFVLMERGDVETEFSTLGSVVLWSVLTVCGKEGAASTLFSTFAI